MYLDRNKSLVLVSVLALSVAYGCSSKTDTGTGAGGSCTYNCATGGSANGGAGAGTTGGTSFDVNQICNGLFAGHCNPVNVPQVVKTPNMLIVLDESGSMTQVPTGDTVSKWTAMSNALSGALSSSKVRTNINFGLELFPNSGDPNNPITSNSDAVTSCMVPTSPANAAIEVPIISGTDQLNAILSAIQSSTPAGGTPTDLALQQAYTYFTTSPGKDLPGLKYVLLATDGGPNCNTSLSCTKDTCTQNMDLLCGDHTANTTVNCCLDNGYICLDDTATVSAIKNLALASIPTYVVGIPGSQAYEATLNAMAVAGGVPNTAAGATDQYYNVSSMADLQAAFSLIVTQLVTTCDIPLAQSPADALSVEVAINCQIINNVNSADGGPAGFYVDYNDYSPGPAHVELIGTTCASMQQIGATEVDIVTGCTIVR